MANRTRQNAFDTAIAGLIKQGVPAKGDPAKNESQCVYRNAEGHKCAVGQLIPNSKYRRRMEGAVSVRADLILPAIRMDRDDLGFLSALQNLHDSYDKEAHGDFRTYIRREAREFAKTDGLTYAD